MIVTFAAFIINYFILFSCTERKIVSFAVAAAVIAYM